MYLRMIIAAFLIPVAVHIGMRRWDGQMTIYDCPGIKKLRTKDNHFLLPVTMNTIVLCWLGFFLYVGLVGILFILIEAHVIPAEWSSAIIDSLLVYYGLGVFGCRLIIVVHQYKLKQQRAAYWREKNRR